MTYLLSEPGAADLSESATTLGIWANWSQIIGAGAAVVLAIWAIAIATRQLNDARRSALGQFILGIDEAFRSYEDVRKYFNRPSKIPKPDKSDLYRYIAVFERLGLLIKWKLLKPKNVEMLYGHRFEKLISYGKERFEADFGGFPAPSSSPGVGWIHCPLARFGETPKCRRAATYTEAKEGGVR
jgi:hypothetical protein